MPFTISRGSNSMMRLLMLVDFSQDKAYLIERASARGTYKTPGKGMHSATMTVPSASLSNQARPDWFAVGLGISIQLQPA